MDSNSNKAEAPTLKARRTNMTSSDVPLETPLKIVIDDKMSTKLSKFSSILITQLNEEIKSTEDIDVKVIPASNLIYDEQSIKRRRITTTTTTTTTTADGAADIERESIECQTDDLEFDLGNNLMSDLKPTFSDMEFVEFYYSDPNATGTRSYATTSEDESDAVDDSVPDIEVYQRKSTRKHTQPRSMLKFKTMSTQTILTMLPEMSRSTQTSPSLLREYVMSDLTNLLALGGDGGAKMPTNEDLVNKLKNETQQQKGRAQQQQHHLLLVKKRSNSGASSAGGSNRNSLASDSTSFEQPLRENFDIKYAELCQDDEQPKRAESMNTLNSDKSTSFYTVATHLTTNTVTTSTTLNSAQYNSAAAEFDSNRILENYGMNGQLVNLNRTVSSDDGEEEDAKGESGSRRLHSDRTSMISDDDREQEDDYIEPTAAVAITSKLVTELYRSQNSVEEKLVKDKLYDLQYAQSDKKVVQKKETEILAFAPSEENIEQSESTSTLISPNTVIDALMDSAARKTTTIKFNDELDIIEPSETSTPTTSTSNIQAKVDHSSDDAEFDGNKTTATKAIFPRYDQFSTFKWQAPSVEKSKIPTSIKTGSVSAIKQQLESQAAASPQQSSLLNKEGSTATVWDNVPVKPYNSELKPVLVNNKPDLNLEKTLNTFELKESKSKKGLKYVEKPATVQSTPVYSSDSLERRLRASGFNDFVVSEEAAAAKPTPVSKIPASFMRPPRPPPPPPPPSQSPPPIPNSPRPSLESDESIEQPVTPLTPPERPPLPELPLVNPYIPPRISQGSKFQLDGETVPKAIIVDTIEELTVNTTFTSQTTIIKNENIVLSETSLSSDSRPFEILGTDSTNKMESESLSSLQNIAPEVEARKSLSNESKLTFEEANIKRFDVDLTFYDEESVSTTNEQASNENFASPYNEPARDRHHSLSNESRFTLDTNLNIPRIEVDFSMYDEQQQQPQQVAQQPKQRVEERNEFVTSSELTDVTANTSREHQSSLSNESKLYFNTSANNIPYIDVDFGAYDEQQEKTPVDSFFKVEPTDFDTWESLGKESKLRLDDQTRIQTFDVDFNDYEVRPTARQQVIIDSVMNRSSGGSEKSPSTTESTSQHSTVGSKKVFKFDENDAPTVRDRLRSLSTESKLILEENNKIQHFDIDFSMYDEAATKPQEAKPPTPKLTLKLDDPQKSLSKKSIIQLDKENSVKKFDVDFNAYNEQQQQQHSPRNRLRNIDSNLIGNYQSPNSSFNKSPRQQTASGKQNLKFDFPDWENMLHMVNGQEEDDHHKKDQSYNDTDPDDEDDDDGAGTEADIDDNDDADLSRKQFGGGAQQTNGIVNMVFEPVLNQTEFFEERIFITSPKKLIETSENAILSPKRMKSQEQEYFEMFVNLTDNKEHKISVSSVAPIVSPNNNNRHPSSYTTHIERGEIKPESKYSDAQFEISGYNPPSSPRVRNTSTTIPDVLINQNDAEMERDIQKMIARKRLKHQTQTPAADTASVLTETSVDNSMVGFDDSMTSSGGKMSRIQKIMLSIADREKFKLLRRVERRKERVPEILELLKTAKGKDKKKLEDELRLLLRKADKDEQLMKKFNLIDELDLKKQLNKDSTDSKMIKKTKSIDNLNEDNEVRDINTRKSSLSASAASLMRVPGSGSASGFSNTNYNDGYSSAGGASTGSKQTRLTSLRGSGGARESGYSSCDESGAEIRHQLRRRHRYNSYGSEGRLERVEDDHYATAEATNEPQSSLHTAIKSAVNKLPIDSSPFAATTSNSSSTRVLTKSPTLQLGYSTPPPAHRKIVFPPNSNNNRQDERYDLLTNYRSIPQTQHEERVTSLRPPINQVMKSVTSNRDNEPPNTNNQQSTINNNKAASTGGASSFNRNKQSSQQDRNDRDDEDDDQRRNRNPGQQQSTLEPEQLRVQYIQEEELGADYERQYRVERDRQTGEAFIIDHVNNVKYIILKRQDKKRARSAERVVGGLRVDYINRSALDSIRFGNNRGLELELDNRTGETFVQDPNDANHRWVVLPDDWDESDNSDYVAEEDVDSMQWNVFVDKDTNRKYVVDERTGRRYFVVPSISDKDVDNFISQWGLVTGVAMRLNKAAAIDDRREDDPTTATLIAAAIAANAAGTRGRVDQPKQPESVSSTQQGRPSTLGFQIKWPNQSQQQETNVAAAGQKDESKAKKIGGKVDSIIKALVRSPVTQTNTDTLTVKDDETIGIGPPKKPEQTPKPVVNPSGAQQPKRIQIGYVEEQELDDLDLEGIQIFQDPLTEESYLQDPKTNQIWIILPEKWRELELYIPEEDLEDSGIDLYEDELSRRYAIDERSGMRYYVIPRATDMRRKFRQQWSAINNLVNPNFDNVVWRREFDNNKQKEAKGKFRMPPFDSTLRKYPNNELENTVEEIQNFDSEPGTLKKRGTMGSKDQLRPSIRTPPNQSPKISRKSIPRALVLPKSPRPLHHLLLDDKLRHQLMERYGEEYANKENEARALLSSSSGSLGRNWRSSSLLDDPTAPKNRGQGDSPSLDRNRLADVYVNGYRKELPKRRGGSLNSSYMRNSSRSNPYLNNSMLASASGANQSIYSYDSPFLTGVLTERFQPEHIWKRNHRGVQPKTRLHLREQVLATPRSQERVWRDTLSKSYKLKPRIIVINDDERIVAADRNCKFYIQYVYDHDSVLGVDPAYLLMLPDRGPVRPTRPLMASLKDLEDAGADIALREAPVFVYHQNGSAYFENIAQYLAGKYPKLSPKTVRKILQFSNMQEFEDYLESKIARDEAKRISMQSGENLIDVDSIKRDLLNSITPYSPLLSTRTDNSTSYYHKNCEYDSLRNDSHSNINRQGSEELYETKEIELDGVILKSTFVSFSPTGDVERVEPDELPPSALRAIHEADQYDEHRRLLEQKQREDEERRSANRYIPNPILRPRDDFNNFNNQRRPPPSSYDSSKPVPAPAVSPILKPLLPFDERTNNLRERYERYHVNN